MNNLPPPLKSVDNSSLNEQQRAIVQITEAPLLVIAGPGSGKSRTLIERTVHLIVDEHVPVENILLATFTEKAAKELITRISNRTIEIGMPINISDMLIGTLHSIFYVYSTNIASIQRSNATIVHLMVSISST